VSVWFVTGTDTGIGKTIVVAALAAIHKGHGRRVAVAKPAQTGVTATEPGDLDEVARLAGPVHAVEGVRLPEPLAPDRAARLAEITPPSLATQRDLVLSAAADHDPVLVEGAGGVAVNLGISFTLIDVAEAVADAGRPVQWLVVARAGLGTLNHSRLTVGAIRARGMHVHGLIIGAWPAHPTAVELHNRTDLVEYTGVPVLGAVPCDAGLLAPAEFRAQAPQWLPGLGQTA
jgi:dethiobiotin synthase